MHLSRCVLVAALALTTTSVLAAPKSGGLTAKHVDENGDPKKESDKAPDGLWWVSCYINVTFKPRNIGNLTLYFGPWLVPAIKDQAKVTPELTALAATLRTEYGDRLATEFPKNAYKKAEQKMCIGDAHASFSERFWKSRDLGTPNAARVRFVPSFAK